MEKFKDNKHTSLLCRNIYEKKINVQLAQRIEMFLNTLAYYFGASMTIGLYHPPDGVTNLKFKLLYFLTTIETNF
jgi:hypothetical protein